MTRSFSLAYLSAYTLTPPQMIRVAAQAGYDFVGLRLWPNSAGAPQQYVIDRPDVLRETRAAQQDTGVGVFDIEIVRIGELFDPAVYLPLFEAGAALGARAVLVAADDSDEQRLADHYAALCESVQPFGMTADVEFMPWTAVKTAQDAMRLVKQAGHPANAGILVDSLHVARSHTTLADVAVIPAALLHYAQMCDAPSGTHYSTEQMIHTARCERLLPGEGDIDLVALWALLPFTVPVSVEIVHMARMAQMTPLAWAQQCLAASRRVLASNG